MASKATARFPGGQVIVLGRPPFSGLPGDVARRPRRWRDRARSSYVFASWVSEDASMTDPMDDPEFETIESYVIRKPESDTGRYLDLLHGNLLDLPDRKRAEFVRALGRDARQVTDAELEIMLAPGEYAGWRERLTAAWSLRRCRGSGSGFGCAASVLAGSGIGDHAGLRGQGTTRAHEDVGRPEALSTAERTDGRSEAGSRHRPSSQPPPLLKCW
ncbi:DUF6000 family protein [Nonomuraea muscovyensis]|uniref:DUF6000 family protein n=1 Tax=Nonomuraea muscovyensis TaxID=1124761 RepID=UPI0033C0FC4D